MVYGKGRACLAGEIARAMDNGRKLKELLAAAALVMV